MINNNNVFNLEEFLGYQKDIWTKYDSIENISLMKSEKEFINNLDRYILHTLEEVYEVHDAKLSRHEFKDYISELNDVVMYCGTMLSIVNENLKQFNNEEEFKKALPISNEIFISLNDLCLYTLNTLIEIRMLYKKRKWHKSSVELSDKDKYQSLLLVQSKLENIISTYIGFTTKEINEQMSSLKLSEMIFSKQQFVINLKETN